MVIFHKTKAGLREKEHHLKVEKHLREHSGRKMKKKQFSITFLTISRKDVFPEKLIARNVLIKQVAVFSAETGKRLSIM